MAAYSFGEGAKDWAGHLSVETEGDDLEIGILFKDDFYFCVLSSVLSNFDINPAKNYQIDYSFHV